MGLSLYLALTFLCIDAVAEQQITSVGSITHEIHDTEITGTTRRCQQLCRRCPPCNTVTQPFSKDSSETINQTAAQVFGKADLDHNGMLSKHEYNAAVGFNSMKKKSETAMTQDEFLRLFSRRYALSPKALDVKIIEKKGSISGGQENKQSNELKEGEEEEEEVPITARQYFRLSLKTGLPFVAFGFVDNVIMLTAGDQIEATLGVALSLSTMAAAGLGNILSDVFGISASDQIEDLIMSMGLPPAKLTVKQLQSTSAHHVRLLSQVIGVTIGCLLGMWPLLFVNVERRNLKSSFEDADLDKSGKLSSYELTMVLHRSGLMMAPEEIKWLVQRCGHDKEHLNFEEFVTLVQHWNEFNHEYLLSCIDNKVNPTSSTSHVGMEEGENEDTLESILLQKSVGRTSLRLDSSRGLLSSFKEAPSSPTFPAKHKEPSGLASQILWTKYKV